ncbi:hypothetical protein [Sulfitobacter sediminilitoris]|uniref:hypothetical protein n=1 Tax=Sulfitobacter sediminilitoris TaxID=2698830 RepID=UPI001954936B|nr:hypothetical protein [Sulfitobacter sediminilitoris]
MSLRTLQEDQLVKMLFFSPNFWSQRGKFLGNLHRATSAALWALQAGSTASADQLFCANTLDSEGPVTDVQSLDQSE